MADEFGARIDGKYLVICSMPDVCKMPNGTPVPFPITEQLSNSVKHAKHTKITQYSRKTDEIQSKSERQKHTIKQK